MSQTLKAETVFLSNGLPVILQNYDGMVAATYWWNQVGSTDEKDPEAGFAHFLEHMLFKDAAAKQTGKASTGQTALAIESCGGDVNAYTSFDQTVYHVTCAEEHWEKILDAFGVMGKPQRFLKTDFEREREVILEELKKNQDSPGRQIFQSLLSGLFAQHPYGRPVIGFEKGLKKANLKSLENFYHTHYNPNKMGLILVGPLWDPKRKKKLLALLEKRFGSKVLKKPKKEIKEHVRPLEKALRSFIRVQSLQFDVQTPTLMFGFRIPHLGHDDTPALDLLSGILGMGELSRFYQRLFYKESIASEVSAGLFVPNDPGLLYVQAECENLEKLNRASLCLIEEINRIQSEGPTKEEIERVIVNAESEKSYALQTADGVASRIGFLKFQMGDLGFDQQYLELLKSVTSDQIKNVARRYLILERLFATVMYPKKLGKIDFKEMTELFKNHLKPKEVEIQRQIKKSHILPDVIRLPSGLEVHYKQNSVSNVFSIHAAALGGLRMELSDPVDSQDHDWGASNLLAATWTKGTSQMSSQQISRIVEGRAASFDGFSGRNTLGLQMTGLKKDFKQLSEVFIQVACDPSFQEAELEHSRRVTEDQIKNIETHTSQLCSKLFLETLYETHPYRRLPVGSLESLPFLTTEKLKKFHRNWIQPEKFKLAVTGNVSRDEVMAWLKQFDLEFQKIKSAKYSLPNVLAEGDIKAPRWVEKKLGREQTHIIVGGLGLTIHSEDRYSFRILQTILGGQSGRLFLELREKKSMAYTVSPISFEGLEPGYVGTYIACSPDKQKDAILGIDHVLQTLASKGPSSNEMKRAQEYFLGRRAMDLQSDSSLASHYSLKAVYGLDATEEEQISKKIRSVTGRQVQDVCERYLIRPSKITSIVG